jgi:hypothetical protein
VYIEYRAVVMNMKVIFCDFSASVTSFLQVQLLSQLFQNRVSFDPLIF